MRAALGKDRQLGLESIVVVVHHVSFICSRIRARPRLTRLRTTSSEHRRQMAAVEGAERLTVAAGDPRQELVI
jgi:hypothetical protein